MDSAQTTALLVAGITALLGVVLFVARQFALKLLVEPIQDHRRLMGRIASALYYYENVYEGSTQEVVAEARRAYRDLGTDLRSGVRLIPGYRLLARVKLVRSIEQIETASAHLIGLSNEVGTAKYGGEGTERRRREIRESLGIE